MQRADNLVWMDLEMTGLSVYEEQIMEIATVITDAQLNVVAEGPVIAIHLSDAALAKMDEWCQKTHGASGLIQRCKESAISLEQAEAQTLAFIQQYVPAKTSPLCGNSICQDRKFIERYMPQLDAYLHYRLLDVSSFKEAARRWNAPVFNGVQKKGTHTALADIQESIEEMRYYRHNFLITA
ncbi:MAG: oligoribonuclease [Proteobacteria bacterium]|nr:oligoribonuclease [Pseudomonadota bacterium]